MLYGSVVGLGCMHTIYTVHTGCTYIIQNYMALWLDWVIRILQYAHIQYALTLYNTIWLCGWTGLYAYYAAYYCMYTQMQTGRFAVMYTMYSWHTSLCICTVHCTVCSICIMRALCCKYAVYVLWVDYAVSMQYMYYGWTML